MQTKLQHYVWTTEQVQFVYMLVKSCWLRRVEESFQRGRPFVPVLRSEVQGEVVAWAFLTVHQLLSTEQILCLFFGGAAAGSVLLFDVLPACVASQMTSFCQASYPIQLWVLFSLLLPVPSISHGKSLGAFSVLGTTLEHNTTHWKAHVWVLSSNFVCLLHFHSSGELGSEQAPLDIC